MKMRLIGLIIIAMTALNFTGCSKNVESFNKQDKNTEIVQEENKDKNDVLETENLDENKENNTEEASSEETKKVGQDKYGFVQVPSSWVNFKDVDLPDDSKVIQYSDPLGSSIITLNVIENFDQNIEDAAQATAQNIQSNGVDVKGAKVKIDNYDAYQLYGLYEDQGLMLIVWYFMDENNNLHYVSAEGPLDTISNVVGYVEKTYSLK